MNIPRTYKLLDGVNTASEYGPWVSIHNMVPGSGNLQCVGIVGTDSVRVFMSSQKDPTTAEQYKVEDFTLDKNIEVTDTAGWIRAQLRVATGGGTVDCFLTFSEA